MQGAAFALTFSLVQGYWSFWVPLWGQQLSHVCKSTCPPSCNFSALAAFSRASTPSITSGTFSTRIAPLRGRSGLVIIRALFVFLYTPVAIGPESFSVEKIPDVLKQNGGLLFKLLGCSIKGFKWHLLICLCKMSLRTKSSGDVSIPAFVASHQLRNLLRSSMESPVLTAHNKSSHGRDCRLPQTSWSNPQTSKGHVFPWLEFPFWGFHLWSCESSLLSLLWLSELTLPTILSPTW